MGGREQVSVLAMKVAVEIEVASSLGTNTRGLAKIIDRAIKQRADAADWQPIETAPKDGSGVLLWWPQWWHDAHSGYFKDNQWHSERAIISWYEGNDNGDPGPSHWMPLPTPPQEPHQ
jgi:hypothetical protein